MNLLVSFLLLSCVLSQTQVSPLQDPMDAVSSDNMDWSAAGEVAPEDLSLAKRQARIVPFIKQVKTLFKVPYKRHLLSDNTPYSLKYFDSMDQLLESNFFRNPNRAQNIYVRIKGEPNFFEVMSDPKKPQSVVVREVSFGKGKSAAKLNEPVTKCAYAHGQNAEIAISKSNSYSRSFGLLHSIQLSHNYQFNVLTGIFETLNNYLGVVLDKSYVNVTVGWSFGVEHGRELSTAHSFGGSITCNSGKNGTVQLFSNLRYRYFPDAKVRYHFYEYKRKASSPLPSPHLESVSDWSKAYSSYQHQDYGLVLYDNSNGAEYACVNQDEFLKCDTEIEVPVFEPAYEPIDGLRLATNGKP